MFKFHVIGHMQMHLKQTWQNVFLLMTHCIITNFYMSHHGCEFGFKLVAMCTIWTWIQVGYHVHNVNLNLGWLPCVQTINFPNAYLGGTWSSWKFHDDRQMFLSLLFNSLTSMRVEMQYFTFKLHFF
jgi:hypothetical protein